MPSVFLVSDTHFGHLGMCRFTRADGVTKLRPWDDPADARRRGALALARARQRHACRHRHQGCRLDHGRQAASTRRQEPGCGQGSFPFIQSPASEIEVHSC